MLRAALVAIPCLLVPDAPVVVWWPGTAPDVPAAVPTGSTPRTTSAAAAFATVAMQTQPR